MNQPNEIATKLAALLGAASSQSHTRADSRQTESKIHVGRVGKAIMSAYEQLRNAAEYTDENLLRQRATRRFFRRLFLTGDETRISRAGQELVIELTLAGYLPNDSVTETVSAEIDRLADAYYAAYRSQRQSGRRLSLDTLERWFIDTLAIRVESLLGDYYLRDAFVQFAFEALNDQLDKDSIFSHGIPDDYELRLFTAVHRVLLHSDDAIIRDGLLGRFQRTPDDTESFIVANQQIDDLLEATMNSQLERVVDRNGAVLRIIWRMMHDQPDLQQLLLSPEAFLTAFENQVATEYADVGRKVRSGVIRSIIFLVITKFLIGIAIEVPYDIFSRGNIHWLPLSVNLLAPPLYMVLLSLTLRMPGPANTQALIEEADRLLYRPPQEKQKSVLHEEQYGAIFNVIYWTFFAIIFGLVGWGLVSIGFSIVHLLIFIVFFSVASFLGFRLSRTVRELETLESEQNGLSLARDFFYMPFVVVGRWLSNTYSKVNIVGMTLDMLIELPLKTIVRRARQWSAFLNSKKDRL